MTTHYCGKVWVDGPAAACPKHQKLDGKRRSVWGRNIRRRMDKEAGVVGTHRGDYISGKDEGR